MLYRSLILPVLDYGDIVYMAATKTVISKLQQIQNVCCHVILRKGKCASITEMHRELELLKLEDQRDQHLSELCHKNIYFDIKPSSSKFIKRVPVRNQRETRQRNKMPLVVPKTFMSCGRNPISVRGPMHWGSLPMKID